MDVAAGEAGEAATGAARSTLDAGVDAQPAASASVASGSKDERTLMTGFGEEACATDIRPMRGNIRFPSLASRNSSDSIWVYDSFAQSSNPKQRR
jgi:hypothetical protein